MITADFFLGLLFGLVLAVIGGWFVNLYRNWIKTRDAYKKPQIVIHTTSKTPEQVGKEADTASLKMLLFNLSVLLVAWLVIELFVPEVAQLIRTIFRSLMSVFFG